MEIRELPTNQIDIGEFAQRFDYEGDEQEELTASIRTNGVLVPLIVAPEGERYTLVEGHRRLTAARRVGLLTLPCHVLSGDLALSRKIAFVVNICRKDPTPIELAVAVAKAVQDGAASLDELAHGLNRSVDWVKRQVAMMDWPEDVLQLIHAGHLSVAAAANLAQIEDPAYREFLSNHAVNNGATARTTASWLQEWRAGQPAPTAVQADPQSPEPTHPPLMPQAPCLCCGLVHRTDELSHVPLCAPCIQKVRHLAPRG